MGNKHIYVAYKIVTSTPNKILKRESKLNLSNLGFQSFLAGETLHCLNCDLVRRITKVQAVSLSERLADTEAQISCLLITRINNCNTVTILG